MGESHEAMLYEKLDDEKVRCELCGHKCVIVSGEYGRCRVRQNVAGSLRSLTYGLVVALNVDPIEKKPLFHYLPGTRSLSIAAPGCNFQCEFCQNWQISQGPRMDSQVRGQAVSPEQVVSGAIAHDCASISYTYTEPTVFFEMAYDTALRARRKNIGNVFVSNGYMSLKAIEKIAPCLDAINVDLKAFRDETYQRVMKARLDPVLSALRALVAAGVWVEVTTLIVPGMNDSPEELGDIAGFIATDLGRSVPWHVSRFHGDYKMADVRATPIETMALACRIGRDAGLRFVYSGNLPGCADESTHCPNCREMLIDRHGYMVRGMYLSDGRCPKCGESIEGVWSRR